MSTATTLVKTASGQDPRAGLKAVAALRVLLDTLEQGHVERARAAGWTWAEVARELGVSRQAVHKKYSR